MRHALDQFAIQRSPSGLCFWGQNFVLPARLQSLLLALNQPAGPDVEVIKRSTRRSVLRVHDVVPGLRSIIVKGFPLEKIELRLKYRKYGLAEFSHYQQAASSCIPAPACYGYFEVRAFGFVKANGVLLEDLAGWRSLAELVQAEPMKRPEILGLAIPLLKQLYETGVNHIDTTPQNMLQSPNGTDLRLIDWQYCSFVTPRQNPQLLLQATHFLNYAGLPLESPEAGQWLAELAATCRCPMPLDHFRQTISALRAHGQISATRRLGLMLSAVW